MARTFRRQRTAQPIAELNVTNLIDLGFTLLIIFMVATPLIQQEQMVKVNLPQTSQAPQSKPDPKETREVITIQADGGINVGSRRVTMAQLDRELAGFASRENKPVIDLRIDQDSRGQQIVSVYEALYRHGLSRVGMPTQVKK